MASSPVHDHETVWVRKPGWTESIPAHYAHSGAGLVVFGDRGRLAELVDGDHATATIREHGSGNAVDSFAVTVAEVARGAVDHDALRELVAPVHLGNNPTWVNIRLEELAESRRFMLLRRSPPGTPAVPSA
jgi:hypothetical protein